MSRAPAAATAGPTSAETSVRSVRPATIISHFAPVSPGGRRGGLAPRLLPGLCASTSEGVAGGAGKERGTEIGPGRLYWVGQKHVHVFP